MRTPLVGVNVSTSATSDPVAFARLAEDLGFDFLSASDHPFAGGPNHETWTMLTWIAAATSRICVASRVLGVPFRPPALLAKMAATLDRFAAGRLILGLGAGALDQEILSVGRRPGSPRERLEDLQDAVTVIGSLWTQPGVTFRGRRIGVEDATIEPRPGRRIPIWLGTFKPKGLALTGRLADGWIPSLGYMPIEDVPAMLDTVLSAASDAGRKRDELTCILNLEIVVDGTSPDRPDAITGPPQEVAERLRFFLDTGFDGFNVISPVADPGEQLHLLARDVLPLIR